MIKNIINAIKYLLYLPVYILQILFLIILFFLVWVGIPMLLQGALFSIILFIPAIIDLFILNSFTYKQYDLFARYFGMGLGTIIGLFSLIITYLCLWIEFSYFLNTRNSAIVNAFENTTKSKDEFFKNTTEDKDEDEEEDEEEDEDEDEYEEVNVSESSYDFSENSQCENEQKEDPLSLKRWLRKKVLIPLLWIILAILSCTICGFFTGYIIDFYYASNFYTVNTCPSITAPIFSFICSNSDKFSAIDDAFIGVLITVPATLIGAFICIRTTFLLTSDYRHYSKVYIYAGIANFLLPLILTVLATWYYCQPSIPYKERELTPGVYLYTNDTAYNVTGVNIYSSRCGGFAHSGFFLITKDPKAENAQRRKDGLKDLKFIKLQRGYYVNMISMAVPDVDGFTNYQSRCYPQENAYDFDTKALKNYLVGHSPNDLPAPAVRLIHVPVTDVHKAWNRIDEFKQTFNKRFPDGMIYSPVPYTDEHVKTINCNTYSAAVIDTLDKEKLIDKSNQKNICQFEKLINRFGNFGRQKLSDGQRLNEFLAQDDAPEQVKRQWEFVKTTPLSEQNFWANVLHPDGSYGKRLSKLVNKPKD